MCVDAQMDEPESGLADGVPNFGSSLHKAEGEPCNRSLIPGGQRMQENRGDVKRGQHLAAKQRPRDATMHRLRPLRTVNGLSRVQDQRRDAVHTSSDVLEPRSNELVQGVAGLWQRRRSASDSNDLVVAQRMGGEAQAIDQFARR